MTPSELKRQVENARPETNFFTRDTMKYFGDTMKNYGVRTTTTYVRYDSTGNLLSEFGKPVEVWELYRKKPVKWNIQGSAYFYKDTFRRAYSVNDGSLMFN